MRKFLFWLVKPFILSLIKDEIDCLREDIPDSDYLLNDNSFIYEISEQILYTGELLDNVEDRVRETLDALESRIEEIEEELKK